MMQPYLPTVLQQPNNNSLSVERVLRNVVKLLEENLVGTTLAPIEEARLDNTLDDIDVMLKSLR